MDWFTPTACHSRDIAASSFLLLQRAAVWKERLLLQGGNSVPQITTYTYHLFEPDHGQWRQPALAQCRPTRRLTPRTDGVVTQEYARSVVPLGIVTSAIEYSQVDRI